MTETPDWPAVRLVPDPEDAPDAYAVLTALTMDELVIRLERMGRKVAASANGLPNVDRPMFAFELKIGPQVPAYFRDLEGEDLVFVQAGLSWKPEAFRSFGLADVWVLAQSLEGPRWLPASAISVPPVDERLTAYYVVYLPTSIATDQPLHVRARSFLEVLEVGPDLVQWPPHPLVRWGSPPN